MGQRLICAGPLAALGARNASRDEDIVFILLEGEWLPGPGGIKEKSCFVFCTMSGVGWHARIETHTHTHTHLRSRACTQARVIHTNTHININTTTQTHTTNNAEFLSYTPIHLTKWKLANEGNNSDFSFSFIIVRTNVCKACVYDRPELLKVFVSVSVRTFTEVLSTVGR